MKEEDNTIFREFGLQQKRRERLKKTANKEQMRLLKLNDLAHKKIVRMLREITGKVGDLGEE